MSNAAAQNKQGGGKLALLLLLAPAILLPLAPATFALAMVYMLPTIIIASTRLLRVSGAVATMFGMNMSGALPGLVAHWERHGTFDDAFRMMLDPEFLMVNLAACAIGLVLLFAAPFIARAWVDIASARLRARAISQRKRLLDEWGDEVRGDHPAP